MPNAKRYANRNTHPAPDLSLCECGCGEKVGMVVNGIPSRYRVGHDKRGRSAGVTVVLLDIDAYWRAIERRAAQ